MGYEYISKYVPAGLVMMFAGTSSPEGWLACNGASLLRADYPALFTAIGTTYGSADGTHFNIPDMRGLFVRGSGAHGSMTKANGGAFDGGSVGGTSNDSFQGFKTKTKTSINGQSGSGTQIPNSSGTDYSNGGALESDGTNGTPRTGNETKPASISLLYCIKT